MRNSDLYRSLRQKVYRMYLNNRYFWFYFCRSKPLTPPSRSATEEVKRDSYTAQLKRAFTSVPFLLIFFALGGGVAFTITFQTITQEVLCPLGYTDVNKKDISNIFY